MTLDAKYAMSSFSPAMDIVRRGETCDNFCRSASAYSSQPYVIDLFNASMFSHATVGALYQNIPM